MGNRLEGWHLVLVLLVVFAALFLRIYGSRLSPDAFSDSTTGIKIGSDVLKILTGATLMA